MEEKHAFQLLIKPLECKIWLYIIIIIIIIITIIIIIIT